MAAILNGLFGGNKPSASPVPAGDSDFADFAGAPDPSPASFSVIPSAASISGAAASATGAAAVPYTKWYNVHERYSLGDFQQEGVIAICIFFILLVHLWGTRANRAKARQWIDSHRKLLLKEFALVGVGKTKTSETVDSSELLKEESPNEFTSYLSGRQNIAFADIRLSLFKRYNPTSLISEFVFSFLFDSFPTPTEKVEIITYPFDGKEALTVPGQLPGAGELRARDTKSSYDGFVLAVVNKDTMKQLREDRYDVSITLTKDHAKLPNFVTVMSESAEVTDLIVTPELSKAIEQAGDLFNHIIITDQPIDKPTKIEETVPKKRLYLSMKMASSAEAYQATLPLYEYFLRLPDQLATSAHFRPEVMRKVKATREEAISRLQKAADEEKAEERALEREKAKKLKRDLELKGLDAKAQKKYLEKEKEKEYRKASKRQTQRA